MSRNDSGRSLERADSTAWGQVLKAHGGNCVGVTMICAGLSVYSAAQSDICVSAAVYCVILKNHCIYFRLNCACLHRSAGLHRASLFLGLPFLSTLVRAITALTTKKPASRAFLY